MNGKNIKTKLYIVSVVDVICIIVSYYFSMATRMGGYGDYNISVRYQNALIILIFLYLFISRFYMSRSTYIFKRGYLREFMVIFRSQSLVLLIWFFYLFLTKQSSIYSRFIFLIFYFISLITIYVARCYFKLFTFLALRKSQSKRNCVLITVSSRVDEVVAHIQQENEWDMLLGGIIVIDEDMTGSKIGGVKVWGDYKSIYDTLMYHAVDEVFINIPYEYRVKLEELILLFEKMGVLVHLNVDIYNLDVKNKTIDNFSGYHVVTFATSIYNIRSLFLKRLLDIIGSLVGLILTGIAFLFVAPAIAIESRGPIFFAQSRVGKNGRIFKIYKFRSMYMDAEERKKELMDQNEMQGLMFKMKDDPRITKVGKFIRKTSLDELPQFFNILKGDMSLVGTRPPTVDEFKQYEAQHRRRLSIKPGLTGMWQVSGRNEISNFEEVVKFDLEYIDNWSVGLDVKLLLKTCLVVISRSGR